ncbi:MAG: DUF1501 domain-containing protein [Candidatus Hydrogenedentes bacterium]|nr:DUF1501 domain-containing protein [Candidatus Hydrogenedentota bacterium]
MSRCTSPGCKEYRGLNRRQFLGASSTAVAATLGAPLWLPRVAFAADGDTSRDVLVVIFLRGGCDGLSICVPYAEDAYYEARPTIAIPRPDSGDTFAATDLDGFFGIPPAMTPLKPAYDAGHLLFVHACGSKDESRSHFDAMRFMEIGKPRDASLFTGWVGRHLLNSTAMSPTALLRAIAINDSLQTSLAGSPLALPIQDLDNFSLDGIPQTLEDRLAALGAMYAQGPLELRASAANTLSTMASLDAIDFGNYTPSGNAEYPDSGFGYAMKSAAALIKAQIGVEAIATDLGGWDTHDGQNPINGYMAGIMEDLASSLGAFHADLTSGGVLNFTLVVMSEFGRVFRENASQGTDHGHGNMMLVMGGGISGGRVLRNWPGLAPENLFQEQDLDVTIDYRDILAEIIQKRLGNSNLGAVFPEFIPTFRGVTV